VADAVAAAAAAEATAVVANSRRRSTAGCLSNPIEGKKLSDFHHRSTFFQDLQFQTSPIDEISVEIHIYKGLGL
jgi:hypothetical protein